ncbi:MAG TPA: hypothetical protein PLZ51_29770, partial [Aggregatilineales bacterium]|nr:hypothetical protein [Aggregatilineales bacterium]
MERVQKEASALPIGGIIKTKQEKPVLRSLLFKMRAFIALILLFAFFSVYSGSFLSTNNLIILAKQASITAI